MAKYCIQPPLDGVYPCKGPMGLEGPCALGANKPNCPSELTSCLSDPPKKFGACKQCGPTRYLACVPGCVAASRYSTCDWETAYNKNHADAEEERNRSEQLRRSTWIYTHMSDKQSQNRQCSNGKKLAESVYEISFWKNALIDEAKAMRSEMDNMNETIRVMEKTMSEAKFNQSIIDECLIQREKRLGIECTHDDVERALCKEVEINRKVQEMLKEFITRSQCVSKKCRAVLHNCEMDINDKHHAQGIDDSACQKRNCSCGVNFHPGIENIDGTISTPDTYARYANNNINLSMTERQGSESLRGQVDCFLRGAVNEMWHQYNQTTAATNARRQEVNDAKTRLENQLNKTNEELRSVDRSILTVRAALIKKENYLRVAQTRLEERTHRRCIELNRDEAMLGLQCEVKELVRDALELKQRLKEAENTYCRLLKMRSTLEQDIGIKQVTLEIDGAFCLGLRKKMPMDPKIGPILVLPHIKS